MTTVAGPDAVRRPRPASAPRRRTPRPADTEGDRSAVRAVLAGERAEGTRAPAPPPARALEPAPAAEAAPEPEATPAAEAAPESELEPAVGEDAQLAPETGDGDETPATAPEEVAELERRPSVRELLQPGPEAEAELGGIEGLAEAPGVPEAIAAALEPGFTAELGPPSPEDSPLGPAEAPYDAVAARAEVDALLPALLAAPDEAETRLRADAQAASQSLLATGRRLRAGAEARAARAVATIRAAVAAERLLLDQGAVAARAQIDAQHDVRRDEVTRAGDDAKERMRAVFRDHRASVLTTVGEKIAAAEELRRAKAGFVHDRTLQAAESARQQGREQAARYPDSERGRVQAEAALGVASEAAAEMEEREPEAIEATNEITAELPAQFEDAQRQMLDGFDRGLPDLLAGIDRQVADAHGALAQQARLGLDAVGTLRTQVRAELDELERVAVGRAEAVAPQARERIDAGVRLGAAKLRRAVATAVTELRGVVGEAAEILAETEEPDVEAARGFVAQVQEFCSGAADDAAESIATAAEQMSERLAEAGPAAEEGCRAVEALATSGVATLHDGWGTVLADLPVSVDDAFGALVTDLGNAFVEVEREVAASLAQPVGEVAGDMDATLRDAGAEIDEAVGEGLAKNDEALRELPGDMREAASDAAWDYDHPILSTLADIGAIVAGVIVGLVAALALVVVAIVAFKLIIAGLIALGVSALVAKLVVAAVGVGLLAYGIYSAYADRRARGEAGGWATFGGALLDVSGITDIRRAFTDPRLTPFERGLSFGQGIGTLASLFLARRMSTKINIRLARYSFLNPQRGAGLRFLRARFGGRGRAAAPGEIAGRGYRPAPGERLTTRQEFQAQYRAERIARAGRIAPDLAQRQRGSALLREAGELAQRARDLELRAARELNPARASRMIGRAQADRARARALAAEGGEYLSGRRSAVADLPGAADVEAAFQQGRFRLGNLVQVAGAEAERTGNLPRLVRAITQSRSGNRVVYRVEGGGQRGSQELIRISPNGDVRLSPGRTHNLNFGSYERAVEFLLAHRQQGRGARIVAFEVDAAYFRALRSAAVPEFGTRDVRGVARLVDVRFAADQLQVLPELIPELQRFIIPGSGRVVDFAPVSELVAAGAAALFSGSRDRDSDEEP